MTSPLLSVIVPVYNVQKYLRSCLDSILRQTLHNMEIICVDDGSTDQSSLILAEYAAKDTRVTVITQENRGLSGARNTGMDAAQAEYITFVDSDDSIGEPTAYEQALAHMEGEVGFVAYGVKMVDENGKEKKTPFIPHSLAGKVELTEQVMLQSEVCVWNKIFRRSIIRQNAIRFPEGLWFEDNYFFHVYGSMCRYAYYMPNKWYCYRRRSDSIIGQVHAGARAKSSRDGIEIVRRIANYWDKRGMLSTRIHHLGHVFLACSYHSFTEMRFADEDRRAIILQEISKYAEEMNFSSYPDLAYVCNMLKKGRYPQQRIKRLGGLIYARQRLQKRTISLLGIPIWENRYRKGGEDYLLFSCLRVHRKEYNKTRLFKQKEIPLSNKIFSIDDTQIINELKALGSFSYQPNDGNMGDALIADVTMRWMDMNHLPWRRLKKSEQPENIVYGGGGIWTPDYIKGTHAIMQKMQHAKRVVILPSSFRDVPELVRILDERFVVFCREKVSYDYLCAQHTGARILLDHDMAFRANVVKKPAWWKTLKKNRYIRKLQAEIASVSSEPHFYRTDAESTSCRVGSELDISSFMGWFRPGDSRAKYELGAWALCSALAGFDHIYTDRLHVGIAAMLCGVRVTYRDNSYGKILAVYEQSLKEVKLVKITGA